MAGTRAVCICPNSARRDRRNQSDIPASDVRLGGDSGSGPDWRYGVFNFIDPERRMLLRADKSGGSASREGERWGLGPLKARDWSRMMSGPGIHRSHETLSG